MQMKQDLLNNLPFDVIVNHIIPFTYKPQPQKLLRDIRSYYPDYQMLENYYTFDCNDTILMRDILLFCNTINLSNINYDNFYSIMRRNFYFHSKTNSFISIYIHRHFDCTYMKFSRRIRFYWGLFTPRERTAFINRHIISVLQEN
uniref:Uncharacterized protein n=1 Tax=viral metagenome TaxID=1070528 RepID=A0A6C0JN63_9ZZZZ